jgi:hypothetical protein
VGLLDDFSSFIKTPEGVGLLSTVFGGLAGARPGAPLNNIGRAGLAGLTGYSNAQDQQSQLQQAAQMKQLRDFQLNDLMRKQAEEDATRKAFSDAYQSPGAQAISMDAAGPTNAKAAMIPMLKPKMDVNAAIDNLMQTNPMMALKLKKSMVQEPIKLGADESLLDPNTYKPLATGMGKTPSVPSAIQEYQFAKGQGYQGTFQDYQLEQKKAGANNTSLKIDNQLGGGLATQVGPMITASKSAAEGALQTMDIAKRIDDAANSGKLIAGPMSGGRVKLLQIGEVLGINGASDTEKLSNTRSTIQGLAQFSLAGRSSLKGQGQISDYEGKLLQKATSGDIADLTIPELKVISNTARRVANAQYQAHARNMKVMRSKPDLQGIADFYDVPPLPSNDNWAIVK